ncbi:hypothetical protein EMCRGX_G009978 [Ephydatia muelleri]
MGRKGKVDTRRKPILQLDENKKSGAKSNKKNPRKEENTAKQKYQPLYVDGGAGEVFDPQEQEKVAAEIETFLKEIVAASKQGKENLGDSTGRVYTSRNHGYCSQLPRPCIFYNGSSRRHGNRQLLAGGG